MELHKIKSLIEKYLEGETTLQEEKALKAYFRSGDVDESLATYKVLFTFYEKEKQITYEKPTFKAKKKFNYLAVASVAIILLIVATLQFGRQTTESQAYIAGNKELAKENTEALLAMVTNVVTDGAKKLQPIKELPKTTNKILK
ncbi:hypothetical protein [Mesonia sp. K7]|uniref:hypothetical protein n=1 Tax=Mesonia sp. K7 TaxID=2218606 RepID=UPI000DAAD121|nr:hypothetical protein [Mesonia sp. K7]PZD79476.1 hypothetical protein DNG35_00250 [Mesonia sp. K7]